MALANQLLVIRPIGETEFPYWLPSTDDHAQLLLEDGEKVDGVYRCRVSSLTNPKWKIDDMEVHVTDRRLVFLTTNYDKGGGWVGFGGVAVVAATAANVVSKRRAATRSAGNIAIGQIRYEWLVGAVLQSKKALIGAVDRYLHLLVKTASGVQAIELWKNKVVTEAFAERVASLAIEHRLNLDVALNDEARSGLLRQQAGGKADVSVLTHHHGDKGWLLGGDIETLVAASAAKMSGTKSLDG